jgi:hypothetical protein
MSEQQNGGLYLRAAAQTLLETFGLSCTHKNGFWLESQKDAENGAVIVAGPCKTCGEPVQKAFTRESGPA